MVHYLRDKIEMVLAKLTPLLGVDDIIHVRRDELDDLVATGRLRAVPVEDDEGGECVSLAEAVKEGNLAGLDQLRQVVLGR